MHHFAAQSRSAKAAALNTDHHSDNTVTTDGITSFMAGIPTMPPQNPWSRRLARVLWAGSPPYLFLTMYTAPQNSTGNKVYHVTPQPSLWASALTELPTVNWNSAPHDLSNDLSRLWQTWGPAAHCHQHLHAPHPGHQDQLYLLIGHPVTWASVDLVGGVFLIISAANIETDETARRSLWGTLLHTSLLPFCNTLWQGWTSKGWMWNQIRATLPNRPRRSHQGDWNGQGGAGRSSWSLSPLFQAGRSKLFWISGMDTTQSHYTRHTESTQCSWHQVSLRKSHQTPRSGLCKRWLHPKDGPGIWWPTKLWKM